MVAVHPNLASSEATNGEPLSEAALQRELAHLSERRLRPRTGPADAREELAEEYRLRLLEISYIERERRGVAPLVDLAPIYDATLFVNWFEDLNTNGPGQNDPLFPWLANTATYEQVRWFLTQ